LFTVISNIVKELLLGPFHFVKKYIKVFLSLSQEELNDAYKPKKYDVEYRYSFLLFTVLFSISFSGLFPPLLWIELVFLVIVYPIDKFNIIFVYARNDHSTDHLFSGALKSMVYGYLIRFFIMVFFIILQRPFIVVIKEFLKVSLFLNQ
jgi:hypothetical protein